MADPALAGLGRPVELDGVVYHLGRCTFAAEAAFALWVQQEAYLAVQRHRGVMDDVGFRAALEVWADRCAAHEYDYGEPACHRALGSAAGVAHMAWLLSESHAAESRKAGYVKDGAGRPIVPLDHAAIDRARRDPAKWAELRSAVYGTLFPNEGGAEAPPPAATADAPAA